MNFASKNKLQRRNDENDSGFTTLCFHKMDAPVRRLPNKETTEISIRTPAIYRSIETNIRYFTIDQ